ncbi:hypothetical protein QUF76_02775 [Desulfobacterales bacterium HSG16]|nr:hypothetical protein [Desulfobacterales bacterium HSG16]
MSAKRPRVRIKFKFNMDTGEIEEFIIDDNSPEASEAYHNEIARAIASRLGNRPEIEDAGAIRLSDMPDRHISSVPDLETESESEQEENSEILKS